MVLIIDGSFEHLKARIKENRSFRREKFRFVTAFDLIQYLKQCKQILLLACESISELPSYRSTMT